MKFDGHVRWLEWLITGAALLLSLLMALPARAASEGDALALYEKAIDQINSGNPAAAIDSINRAIKIHADSGKIRQSGMFYKGYYPHYALGLAYFEQEDFASAARELQTEQNRGLIQKDSDPALYEKLKNRLGRARTRLEKKEPGGAEPAAPSPAPAVAAAAPPPSGSAGGEKAAVSGPPAGTSGSASHAGPPPTGTRAPSTESGSSSARGVVPAPAPPGATSPRGGAESAVPGKGRLESKGIDSGVAAALDSSDAVLSHHRSFLGSSTAKSLADLRARVDKARGAGNAAEARRLGDQLKTKSASADAAVRKASDAVREAFRSAGQGRYPEAIQTLEQAVKTLPDVPAIRIALARLYFAEGVAKVPADDREVDRAREQIRAALVMKPDLALPESFFPPQFVRMARDARP